MESTDFHIRGQHVSRIEATILNAPQTTFPVRAHRSQQEPRLLKRWKDEKVFTKANQMNEMEVKKFVLHDGPPFANGKIHLGHCMNKVLKDAICKFKRMTGYEVHFRPGFDCHGLPIELYVNSKHTSENPPTLAEFREHVSQTIREQIQGKNNVINSQFF